MNREEVIAELLTLLQEYLKRPSSDGKPIRQLQRKQLQELLDQIK